LVTAHRLVVHSFDRRDERHVDLDPVARQLLLVALSHCVVGSRLMWKRLRIRHTPESQISTYEEAFTPNLFDDRVSHYRSLLTLIVTLLL
jgi:hypothetical protein